jgi:hypothetical protein
MSWWLTPQPASRSEQASAASANARRLILLHECIGGGSA